jgi:hypothetical protein
MVVVTFTSKREERSDVWGQIRVPAESVAWTDSESTHGSAPRRDMRWWMLLTLRAALR